MFTFKKKDHYIKNVMNDKQKLFRILFSTHGYSLSKVFPKKYLELKRTSYKFTKAVRNISQSDNESDQMWNVIRNIYLVYSLQYVSLIRFTSYVYVNDLP